MIRIFHTIVEEFRELDVTTKQLRKFGFLVGGVLLLLSVAGVLLFGKTVHPIMITIGLGLMIIAATLPRLLLWPYYIWMGIAIVLGTIISPIVLSVLFFIVLTPVGILKRLFSPVRKNSQHTYWLPHEGSQDPKRMEELF